MHAMSNSPRKVVPRAARQDGDATRQALLDAAGAVFAERGLADATSKEICARAGANIAAVNYHFGSRDQLYEAVLIEAHHHLVKLEELQTVAARDIDPREKMRTILTAIVHRAAGPQAHWGSKVVIRELLSPSAHAPALVHQAIAPKAQVLAAIVAEILQLPPASPGLQRGLFLMMSPCLTLLIAPRGMREKLFPSLHNDLDGLVDDMLRYATAGLAALAAQYRSAQP
jgi:AcrR family transcriptional regulator